MEDLGEEPPVTPETEENANIRGPAGAEAPGRGRRTECPGT